MNLLSTARFLSPLAILAAVVVACGSENAVDDAPPSEAPDATAESAAPPPGFGEAGPPDGASDASITGGDAGNPNVNASGCSGTQTSCSGKCVVTSVDPNNCGACGKACAPGEVCFSSGCRATCGGGLKACGGTCVDTKIDNKNCGGCGTICGAGTGCVGSTCVAAVAVGPAPTKCAGGGPPIVVNGPPVPTCTGALAAVSFTYGLCACHDIGVPELTSDSFLDAFDSKAGPYAPNGKGGSAGANGSLKNTSQFNASGDIRVSGAAGQRVGAATRADLQLQVAGNLTLNGPLAVGGDAYVGGTISGGGGATIGGTLHTPACGSVPGTVTRAACVSGAVSVPDPCACKPSDIVPVASIVAYYANPANTDNALIGLSPSVFDAPGAPARLDLPCGYYYLDRVVATGVTIAVHGPTALVIGGSIQVGTITFTLDPGATLDVFVGGTLTASSQIAVGAVAYPAGSRFYVGGVCKAAAAACTVNGDCCSQLCTGGHCSGSGPEPKPWSVNLQSNSALNGLFYSAEGAFWTSSDLEMYGAVFAGDYHSTSNTKIHYDRAATKLGDECPVTPPSGSSDGGSTGPAGCGSCRDCGNQACVGGKCGSCTDSAQCCSPLRCVLGTCVSPVN
jgi:hypothetical protein